MKFNLGEQFLRKFSQSEIPYQNQNVLKTFEWMEIDEKCQPNTHRKLGSGNPTVTSFPVYDATSGRIYIFEKYTKTITDKRKMPIEHL
jgi:hypothetical protein